MDYQWHDLLGNIGVLLITLSYLLLQAEKISSQSAAYLYGNLLGAGLIIISLLDDFNLSAMIIEVFWVLISLYGLARQRFFLARQTK